MPQSSTGNNTPAVGSHRISMNDRELILLCELVTNDAAINGKSKEHDSMIRKFTLLKLKIDAGIKKPDYILSDAVKPIGLTALKRMSAEEQFAAFAESGDEDAFMAEMAAMSSGAGVVEERLDIVIVDGTELSSTTSSINSNDNNPTEKE